MKSVMTCLSLSLSLAIPPALAATQSAQQIAPGGSGALPMQGHYLQLDSPPVGPEELESSRGGFIAPGNIQIDIGLEKILMVDGVLQSQTRLSLDNLAASQLTKLSMGMINFMEQGSGKDEILITDTSGFMNQVIQNNMDNKLIQSIKVLDVELRNVGNTGQGSLRQMLSTQLIGALR